MNVRLSKVHTRERRRDQNMLHGVSSTAKNGVVSIKEIVERSAESMLWARCGLREPLLGQVNSLKPQHRFETFSPCNHTPGLKCCP